MFVYSVANAIYIIVGGNWKYANFTDRGIVSVRSVWSGVDVWLIYFLNYLRCTFTFYLVMSLWASLLLKFVKLFFVWVLFEHNRRVLYKAIIESYYVLPLGFTHHSLALNVVNQRITLKRGAVLQTLTRRPNNRRAYRIRVLWRWWIGQMYREHLRLLETTFPERFLGASMIRNP